MLMTMSAAAQSANAPTLGPDAAQASQPSTAAVSSDKGNKKDEKVTQSKDTKKEVKKAKKTDPLVGVDSKLPDKALYDKAMDLMKRGHFDVARLDLQTLLNTYPDSEYQMRAKLAIADSWYREGGTAALTQAEAEYADFRVFFPNAPEAAEAQMRIGDIYFRQMDKPDRDYSKATHAEEEYRRMLTDYPDSTLVPEAKQRLREVQEVLATREAEIGSFYAGRSNWAAAIARDQTVVDSYPEYSHIDDVLIGLGNAYETQAHYIRTLKMPEAAKATLEKEYDDQAAAAYRKVVIEHAASLHVEDARDHLAAMGLAIPEPTPEQVAASAAIENSRRQYRLQDRLGLLFLHRPDVVQAATIGDPSLADPKPTTAPQVVKQIQENFNAALNPGAAKTTPGAVTPATNAAVAAPASTAPTGAAAPLSFNQVANSEDEANSGSSAAAATSTPVTSPASSGTGNAVGIEVVNPKTNSTPAPNTTGNPAADNYGLKPVGATNATALPPVEKPAEAPSQINGVTGATPAAQTPAANGKKNPKPGYDKDEESSSTHKKKKGLGKLNPF
jgi:outer membrane protein assembly factor BamD